MNDNQVSKLGQIEINDLLSQSVANAMERRNSALNSESSLSDLSDDENKRIIAGKDTIEALRNLPSWNLETMGMKPAPVLNPDSIINGMIFVPKEI